jgi:hypothetical protein
VLFRQLKKLRGKPCDQIRVALFYPVPKMACNLVFGGTRNDTKNAPPVRLKLRSVTLALTFSSRLALLLFPASPVLPFSELLLGLTLALG